MDSNLRPAEALARLVEGNMRFIAERLSFRARETATRESRLRLAEGQEPFATVVGCSDSRLPAEIIFDQGLGDLFIVRNAGTVLGHVPLASVEFAVARLGTPLVLVLAHEACGAFRASQEILAGAPAPSESLAELGRRIAPAFAAAGDDGTPHERCERAARIHVRRVAETIAASAIVRPFVESGRVLVVPAYYRLASGVVELDLAGRQGTAALDDLTNATLEVATDAA
jgi:carbonic anhydrase